MITSIIGYNTKISKIYFLIVTWVTLLINIPAFAENITFSGTVTTSCSFSNSSNGSLVTNVSSGNYYIQSGWTNLSDAAKSDISYQGSPIFSISSITGWNISPQNTPIATHFVTGVGFQGNGQTSADNTLAAVNAGADSFSTGDKSFNLDSSNGGNDTIYVKMMATSISPWPAGNYVANTIMTCQ